MAKDDRPRLQYRWHYAYRGTDFVPGNLIVGAHYGILAVVSLFVLVLAGAA